MNPSENRSAYESLYREIKEQKEETKHDYMRQNYEKLPSWSKQELGSSGPFGSEQSSAGALESLCKNLQKRFDEDKEKFMKANADKLPSWSKC